MTETKHFYSSNKSMCWSVGNWSCNYCFIS